MPHIILHHADSAIQPSSWWRLWMLDGCDWGHVVSFAGFCKMQKAYYSDQADKFWAPPRQWRGHISAFSWRALLRVASPFVLDGDLLEGQAAKFTESWNLPEAQNVSKFGHLGPHQIRSDEKGTLRLSAAVKWVHGNGTLTKRGGIHSTCPDMSCFPPALYLLSCGSLFGEDRSGPSCCPWHRRAARLETWSWTGIACWWTKCGEVKPDTRRLENG